jgi:glycosyltransferase involved in cell wall biosynthesis
MTEISSAAQRILIAVHGHPMLSNGGAEVAAYQLFKSLSAESAFDPWFLACVRDQLNQKLGAPITQPFSDREFLYSTGAFDWFKFANRDPAFPTEFTDLLQTIKPDIVHFHHYINFGMEAFLHVRRALPDAKIVLTLHEYLAICHHYGQMIKTDRYSLCYSASPIRCSNCFKDIMASDFFLREQYIKRFFDLVDHFISPSRFLAERYIAWGIPSHKLSVIENVIAGPAQARPTLESDPDEPLRVGFFGQISLLKGINVLFDAAKILEQGGETGIIFEIYGDYRHQPPEFQDAFLKRLDAVGFNVKFHGPYDQNRVDACMQSVDMVLTPSIWWENSPVVIQEALRNRRPVICSDIGGMAEKVRNGKDGLHFPAGNAVALAKLLRRLAADRGQLDALSHSIEPPATTASIVDQHVSLYNGLR